VESNVSAKSTNQIVITKIASESKKYKYEVRSSNAFFFNFVRLIINIQKKHNAGLFPDQTKIY
jgi:hypothetical protein